MLKHSVSSKKKRRSSQTSSKGKGFAPVESLGKRHKQPSLQRLFQSLSPFGKIRSLINDSLTQFVRPKRRLHISWFGGIQIVSPEKNHERC